MLGKIFDKGNKGFLTKQEQEQAHNAIKGGLEQNFVWNVEQAGNHRTYRLLQKRGKIIDSEDFNVLRDTYPEFPKQSSPIVTTHRGEESSMFRIILKF